MRTPSSAALTCKPTAASCGGIGRWASNRTCSFTPATRSGGPYGSWACNGDRYYRQGIYLNQRCPFGPVNLIADWAPAQDAPRYWALDLPADAQAWRRGRKRYWIEPTFRDWKSYGFDLEKSKLADPERLDVLLLGIAITTVWLIHVGEWLVASGRRQNWPRRTKPTTVCSGWVVTISNARTLNQRIPVGFTVGPLT